MFKVKLFLSVLSGALFLVAALNPRWIEELTGLEPDGGNGDLEWVFAAAPAVVALVLGVSTFRQYARWRRAAAEGLSR